MSRNNSGRYTEAKSENGNSFGQRFTGALEETLRSSARDLYDQAVFPAILGAAKEYFELKKREFINKVKKHSDEQPQKKSPSLSQNVLYKRRDDDIINIKDYM